MPHPIYPKANKYHRVDKMKQATAPRRGSSHNYYDQVRSNRRKLVARVVLAIAAILLIQSFFQIPYFRVTNVEITGLQRVPEKDVRARVDAVLDRKKLIIFRNNNYFLFKPDNLVSDLETNFYLENVVLNKRFPNTLQISVKERISQFVQQTPETYNILSYSGHVISSQSFPPDDVTIIADEREDRNQPISLAYLEEATALVDAWDLDASLIVYTKLHITPDDSLIKASTDKNYYLLFSTVEEYAPQISRLAEILRQGLVPSDAEYIDLRFENNVYFK